MSLTLTGAEFQEKVIARARALRWLVHHSRPCQRADGSSTTPIQGNAGFPDLVLARGGLILFRELKTETGRLTDAQRHWLDVLRGEVWRPGDWSEIADIIDGAGNEAV